MDGAAPKVKWYDKDIKENYLRPALTTIGGPARLGLLTAAATGIPYYLLAKKAGFEGLKWRTLLFGGLAGLGAYGLAGGRFSPSGYKDPSTEAWVNRLIGMPKTAADLQDFGRDDLFDAVIDMPGYNIPQKNFLAFGVASAPGTDRVDLPSLATGFGKVTGAVTGGLLPMATRAIEGAVIGSAFSHLLGVPPKGRKWITGLSAVADALYGNRLINTVGSLPTM